MGMTNKKFIDKLTENIPTWKLVLIDKWTDFKVWVWLKTHKGVENGNENQYSFRTFETWSY